MSPPVHLVRGDDPSLVRDAVTRLVDELVGDDDRSLAVEDLAAGEYEVAALVDAAQTPPFLTGRRVVVGRGLHELTKADELAPLVAYLGSPLDTTSLVLVWESGKVPKALLDAVKACGGVSVDTSAGYNARAQQSWLHEQVTASGLGLDGPAERALADVVGEDKGRVSSILATLVSTFGAGARLGADDIAPYLGSSGGVAPWELTDAIDRGDIRGALDKLHRMMGGGERHPMVLIASLHGHYGRMLALDGAGVRSEQEAADLLGMKGKSTFPAKKALDQARRLGSARVASAIGLLATADRDLRGERRYGDASNAVVMDVLVARLANLSATAR